MTAWIALIAAVLLAAAAAGALAVRDYSREYRHGRFDATPTASTVAHHALPMWREALAGVLLPLAAALDLLTMPGREIAS